jgi:hypothetical protein
MLFMLKIILENNYSILIKLIIKDIFQINIFKKQLNLIICLFYHNHYRAKNQYYQFPKF